MRKVKYFEGRLEHYAKHVSRIHDILNDESISKKTAAVTYQVTEEIAETAKQASLPLMGAGATRSGGLSKLFNKLALEGLPAL